jgi:hypothetical protein
MLFYMIHFLQLIIINILVFFIEQDYIYLFLLSNSLFMLIIYYYFIFLYDMIDENSDLIVI